MRKVSIFIPTGHKFRLHPKGHKSRQAAQLSFIPQGHKFRLSRLAAQLSFILLAILAIVNSFSSSAQAAAEIPLSQGQTLYVPVYSHIYAGNREQPILLTVTLSIRNIDSKHAITISSVDYHETKGAFLKKYVDKKVVLKPFETTRFIIPQKDKSGGSGANFLVEWHSEKAVNPPLVESVMIGAGGQQGISFTSRGQVITTAN